jgi:hypothetical protein
VSELGAGLSKNYRICSKITRENMSVNGNNFIVE